MSRRGIVLGAVSLGVALGYAIRALASGIPSTGALTYSGVLEDSTGPVNATHNIQVVLYDAASGGTVLCQTSSSSINVAQGHFSLQLPDTCTAAAGANPNVWVDVLVDGSDIGRTKIGAVPYAVEASHAVNSDNAGAANAAAGSLASTLSSLATQSGVGWATTHAGAAAACGAFGSTVAIAKLSSNTCSSVCANAGLVCNQDIGITVSGPQATTESTVASRQVYGCYSNGGGVPSEIGASSSTTGGRYCCCQSGGVGDAGSGG